MRQRARTDENQTEIVDAFRAMGFSVLPLHQVGNGCPDILIGRNRRNYLIEIKDGKKTLSRRKLTPDQKVFHKAWRGEIFIVQNVTEAFALGSNLELRG